MKKTFEIRSEVIRQNVGKALTKCLAEFNNPEEGKKPVVHQVVIQELEEGETERQRKGFYFLAGILRKELGYEVEEIKEMVQAKMWGWKQVKLFGVTLNVLDKPERVGRKEMYSQMIEIVYQLGAESGVVLPTLQRKP